MECLRTGNMTLVKTPGKTRRHIVRQFDWLRDQSLASPLACGRWSFQGTHYGAALCTSQQLRHRHILLSSQSRRTWGFSCRQLLQTSGATLCHVNATLLSTSMKSIFFRFLLAPPCSSRCPTSCQLQRSSTSTRLSFSTRPVSMRHSS